MLIRSAYAWRTHWDQHACFQCCRVKNRRRNKVSQFQKSYGYPSKPNKPVHCSVCSKKMVYVGPCFEAPKVKNKQRWKTLEQRFQYMIYA